MANTKATISEINLKNPDANLTNCLSDIHPYDGIQKCDSPFVGGMLNNIYQKDVEVPEGYNYVGDYNGERYAWKFDDTENHTGVRVYNVTDMNSPVEVLNLSCDRMDDGVSVESKIGYCKVRKTDTGLKYTDEWTIGYMKHYADDTFEIMNPFSEGDSFLGNSKSLSEYIVNYTIIENKLYASILKKDYVEKLYETTWESRYFTCVIFDENGHTEPAPGVNSFVVVGNKVIYVRTLFDKMRNTGTLKHIVVDTDRFYFEVVRNNFEAHMLYTLANDTNRIAGSPTTSPIIGDLVGHSNTYIDRKVDFFSFNMAVIVGSDYWNAELVTLGNLLLTTPEFNAWYLGLNIYTYNDKTVALAINNKIYSYNISNVLWKDRETGNMYCLTNDGKIIILNVDIKQTPIIFINDDMIISDAINSSCNAYDLKNKEAISIFDAPGTINVTATYLGNTKTITCQLGINEQWNNQNLKNVGLNFPPVTIKVDSDYIMKKINVFAPRCPITKSKNWLNYYSGEEDCVYVQSIEWSISASSGLLRFIYINNPILQNMSYPVNTDGNVIYPMPLDSVLEETEFNELIIKTDEGNFLSAHSQNKGPVLGYYLYSISELDRMFLMQTGMYGKNKNYIYGASINNNVTEIGNVVANTLDLQFLGAFPTMALFWSKLDKSIYMFTGDNNLRKLKEAYKVDTIGAIYCDPSKLTLIISTNIGLLILYQDQVLTLDDFPLITDKGKIYYDNNCYFIGDKVIAFSNIMENATARPIHVQTEFYGAGNCVKSVNDCVYIRIGKNNLTEGYLKIKAHTLTEITKVTTEQMFTFNDTMFASVSDQMYIQYQPQLQAGVGFSLEIESSHPISYLAISHTPEAIQQAIKYKPNVIESPTSTPNKNFSFE